MVAGGGTHEAASGRCLLPFLSRGSPLWRAASPAFGVALGGAEAEQFLLCYFHARENQEEEIRSRTQAIRALGRKVGQFHPDEETTLTVMAFRSSDPELHKQMDVAQRFFSDDITAAAGLYYLGFGSNYINEQQERQILSNPEAYALCVAELQPVEEAAR